MSESTMKKHVYKICVVIFAILMALAVVFNIFYSVDAFFTDRIYSRLNGTDPKIIIVGIDEESLGEYGSFTLWSREKLAELIEKLYEDPQNTPAVMGLDFILSDHFDETADEALVEAAKLCDGNIVIGSNIVYRGNLEKDSNGKLFYNTEHIADVEMPYEELENVTVTGFTNACIAKDGYVRYAMNNIRIPSELAFKAGETQDSFAYAVYRLYAKRNGLQPYEPKVNSKRQFQFLYSGESTEYSEVSLKAVLEDRIPMNAFKDSIVLVGAYAPGFQDSYQPASDRGNAMYGVEIHANIIQAYMRQKTMVSVNRIIMALVTAIIITAFMLWGRKKNLATVITASIVLAGLYSLIGRWLSSMGLFIPCVYIFIFLVLGIIYFVIEKYVIEWIKRRHTLDVFKKYVAPQVVDELSHTGEFRLKLGGEKRDIAVLFVDIRGFTTLSENLEPELVVEILNEYLKLVTDCIFKHNGTLDKFIGDAAMAIFNAPFDLNDYVYEAVLAAWDIKKGAAQLEEKLKDRFDKTIRFGIGVNCGQAIVGNIGCDFRMDYTAIGDTVNTAARLESNAGPGEIYISEQVKEILTDRIQAASVGAIPLKGKSKKLEVFSVTSVVEDKGKERTDL